MKNNNLLEGLKNFTVLYVEDNKEISEEVAFFLQMHVKELYVAYDGQEGIKSFLQDKPDLIITDIQMPIMNGLDMIEKVREVDNEVPILITTAFNESEYLLKAINLQVDSYVIKPVNFKELMKKLLKIIVPMELKRELITRNSELLEINSNLDAIAKRKTKELEYFYNHDKLTGLSNFIRLAEEIKNEDYKYLILLDISNFSMINKQYGKVFADDILKEVASALKENLNNRLLLFKTESDHFVFLSEEIDSKKVEEFSQQLISFFDTKVFVVQDVDVTINFCIGISQITEEFFPLTHAEYALEVGKNIGSRYYYFYNETDEGVKRIKENIKWHHVTKKMIKADTIEPFYQPIADAKTGKIIKYEVLARGMNEGECLSPYLFIDQAERLGLLTSITRMMINKSFHYFKDTQMSFSINITQRDLLDEYLLSFLEQKLQRYTIDPSRVTFEILENVTMGRQSDIVIRQLKEIQKLGFQIAIDDFGIESSNFSRLLEIDFDYIKLDGVFIKRLVDHKKDRLIVSAIVNLAKTLGIKTVAEYVENEEIYKIVQECDVDMAQGYYIGKPQAEIIE